jgi:hypothetical protein
MHRAVGKFAAFLTLVLSLASFIPAHAQGTVPVTTVVTALGPKYTPPPALSMNDINVFEGKDKRTVTGFTPAQGDKAGLQLRSTEIDLNRSVLRQQRRRASHFTIQRR